MENIPRRGECLLSHIEGPEISDIQIKRNLVKELSLAASKAYKLPIEIMHVLISVCPNLSFPQAVSGNPLLIASRFRLKDCRDDKKYGYFRTDTN